MAEQKPLREEIADAIVAGFADCGEPGRREEVKPADNPKAPPEVWLYIDGFTAPITISDTEINVPEEFGDVRAGIRLDIQAILATRATS